MKCCQTYWTYRKALRICYSGRFQPPLLTLMVRTHCDYKFLNEALNLLEVEFDYWKKLHVVYVKGCVGFRFFFY